MDLTVIINGVIALFLIMLIGVYGSKRKIITPTINKGLTNILLEISLPCLVVSSFIFDMNDDLKSNIIKCFIYSPISLIITMIVSYIALYPIKSDKKIHIKDMVVDAEKYIAVIGDKKIDLTVKEFELLKMLSSQPDQVFTREQILKGVWGYDFYGDARTVDVTVRRLREKIEKNPADPQYVQTKRGMGYYISE